MAGILHDFSSIGKRATGGRDDADSEIFLRRSLFVSRKSKRGLGIGWM